MFISLQKEFESGLSADYKLAIVLSAQIAEKYGIKIFLIGGIVRDLILSSKIKDIDITVESDAILFCQKLEKEVDCEIVATQENLRTAKVKFASGVEIDFASTREEYYEKSGVLPVAINFGCPLSLDVKRRDFTINTLALALTGMDKYQLVDYYSGYTDIQEKIIRILHDKSFYDDPSRIVRALKFKKRLGFSYDVETFKLMQKYLQNVDETMPLERIKNEFKQYFSIKNESIYQEVIDTMAYKLLSDNPILDVEYKNIENLKNYELYNEDYLWFIYIALIIVNSEISYERLNLSSVEKKILQEVKELQEAEVSSEKIDIYNTYQDKTEIALAIYYVMSKSEKLIQFLTALKQVSLLITGRDLIDLGLIPSPYFHEIFQKILKEKLDGNLKTKEEEINFVKECIKKEE